MKTLELASYIIHQYEGITPLKLQKLLYYAKVWGLVSGAYEIEGDFEKWQFGPVNPETCKAFKNFGNGVIPHSAVPKTVLTSAHAASIRFVIDCYAAYDAITLSAMTHEDGPWKHAHWNQPISEKSMAQYYSQQPFAKNFPFDPEKTFYPIQTDMHYAYVFDMNKSDAASVSVFPSYQAYVEAVHSATKQVKSVLKSL